MKRYIWADLYIQIMTSEKCLRLLVNSSVISYLEYISRLGLLKSEFLLLLSYTECLFCPIVDLHPYEHILPIIQKVLHIFVVCLLDVDN